MSQQVLWEVVKNNNAFLVKSNGLTLSRDPFNPSGVQTYGATGFIQNHSVGLQASATPYRNNVEVSLTKKTKYQRNSNVPAKTNPARKTQKTKGGAAEAGRNTVYSVGVSVRHGVHTVRKLITKRYGSTRVGLQRLALKKAVQLNAATARRSANLAAAAAAKKDQKK